MPRELAYRENGGIAVALVWDPETNALLVTVSDSVTGDLFALDVAGDSALEVFHHPYAYASLRGVDFVPPDRAPETAEAVW